MIDMERPLMAQSSRSLFTTEERQSVRGLLRVTLAPPLATHLLMPDFADFARLHPDIEMEILSSGELANLTNREADVAIRVVYDRKTLPLNLHGLKGPELFGGVYMSCDRLAAWRAGGSS
jgi:DNA-binding transcriptional LysR family regulator